MAEAYLKSLRLPGVTVMSSGSTANAHRAANEPRIPHILSTLDKHKIIMFAKKHPEQLTQARIDAGDVTICMNQIVADECRTFVKLPKDTQVWDVDDVGEGKRVLKPGDDPFKYTEEVYRQLVEHINRLVHQVGPAH